jgi:dTDP-4-amino-4,6-dideoxygalactose transaminase
VCYSFQAVKHLTTADGGAIACKSKEDAARIRKLRWFGLDREFKCASRWEQDITESGFKFNMNNTNAAVGLLQLQYIDDLIDKHIKNSASIRENLNNPHVKSLVLRENRISSSWLYSVLVEDKQDFRTYMQSKEIHADPAHVNNLRYSVFSRFKDSSLSNLEYFDKRLMNIPCGWWLSSDDLDYIITTVNSYRPTGEGKTPSHT